MRQKSVSVKHNYSWLEPPHLLFAEQLQEYCKEQKIHFSLSDNESFGAAFQMSIKVITNNEHHEVMWNGKRTIPKRVENTVGGLIKICKKILESHERVEKNEEGVSCPYAFGEL